MDSFTHEKLPGVSVFASSDVKKGSRQRVMVVLKPDVEIPLHTHDVKAAMMGVWGSATVLAAEGNPQNGREVKQGDAVRFHKGKSHGFKAGPEGFVFESANDGIVGPEGNWDIQFEGS